MNKNEGIGFLLMEKHLKQPIARFSRTHENDLGYFLLSVHKVPYRYSLLSDEFDIMF